MKNSLAYLPFVALTFCCWGAYGPVLHAGKNAMQGSSLRPFICVGIAYFLVAVLFPLALLYTKGEKGSWTIGGFVWSFISGILGALGALGVIMALKSGGNPVYVMPLVFGFAPVVNTFVTMYMAKSMKEASIVFYVGVLLAIIGAAGVLVFKPASPAHGHGPATTTHVEEGAKADTTTSDKKDKAKAEVKAAESGEKKAPIKKSEKGFDEILVIGLFIALAALSWGGYGPVLHKGQMKMSGSRLRPLLCVGLAYFVIAVIIPILLMAVTTEAGAWTFMGTVWSLGGGLAGGLGAIGIIYAFNNGGKPIVVMPLVFGCAPLINTFVSTIKDGTLSQVTAPFFASLAIAITGAVVVLVFAPKGGHKPAAAGAPADAKH